MSRLSPRQASRFILGTILGWCCLVPMSAEAAGRGAMLKLLSGEVVRLRGQWMSKSQPAELSLPGGGRIRFHDNTEASILTDPQSLMLLPGKKSQTYTIILRRGLVDIDVPEDDSARLAVAVGTSTDLRFVTLSGQFGVKVEGRNVIAVSHHGLTTVSQGPKLARLPTDIKRTYQGSGFLDGSLLEATSWVGGRRVWIAADGPVPITGYVWAPVPNAIGYAVTLEDTTTKRRVASTRVREPTLEEFQAKVNPGRYELSIAAVDADGFVSDRRTKLAVSVVGVELPGGAVALPRDTLLLAPEQQVRLTFADGLTLTTADHKSGVAASEPFGLEGLDRAAILIHPPGGGDTSTLTLVRRQPLVSTWVGPKLATWPEDPVELQVSFIDARGRPTPTSVEPTVHVFVGVDPVSVEWNKQGNLWQARLLPTKVQGPWVVRLEVVDQYGVIIGRDFAEIAKTKSRKRLAELDPQALSMKASSTHQAQSP